MRLTSREWSPRAVIHRPPRSAQVIIRAYSARQPGFGARTPRVVGGDGVRWATGGLRELELRHRTETGPVCERGAVVPAHLIGGAIRLRGDVRRVHDADRSTLRRVIEPT